MSLSPRRRHVGQLLRLCAAFALLVNLPLGLTLSATRAHAARRDGDSGKALVASSPVSHAAPAPLAQTTDSMPLNQRVLVVYNANEPESLAVAEHYMTRRNIPASRKCAITPSNPVYLPYAEFLTAVKTPVQQCLDAVGRQNILYIVNSYKVPYDLGEIPPPSGAEAQVGRALDQFIADIWDEIGASSLYNPYYTEQLSQFKLYEDFISLADYRNAPESKIVYSVWRLDAPSAALAKGLVDKAIAAETNGLRGRACFDRNRGMLSYAYADAGYLEPDWNIYRAAEFTRERGMEVIEDSYEALIGTSPAPPRCDNAALYTGWYSLLQYNDAFTWAEGAIGLHLESAAANNPRGGTGWVPNAIQRGLTVTAGSITEPFTEGQPRVDGVFRDLFQGANVGDALFRNTMWLKWHMMFLGDPLYRPYPNSSFPVPPAPVPAPWLDQDIGAVGVAGRSNQYGGNIAVEGSGQIVHGSGADSFHYTFQPLNGDGEIVARVSRLDHRSNISLTGVMFRADLTT
ncbi:MAG TPA: TIGR03790 family protein, partial [Pyrinomonadaceae bacterium]